MLISMKELLAWLMTLDRKQRWLPAAEDGDRDAASVVVSRFGSQHC